MRPRTGDANARRAFPTFPRRNRPLTGMFALGGDGFEPPTLRCKREALQTRYQGKSSFTQVSGLISPLSILPSIAVNCADPRSPRGPRR